MAEAILSEPSLPEFSGDLSHWDRDVNILMSAFDTFDGVEFDAQLPEVIGHLTVEEQAALELLGETGDESPRYGQDTDGFRALFQLFPVALQLIQDDIRTLGNDKVQLGLLEIEKKPTKNGCAPRNSHHLHVDGSGGAFFTREDSYLPKYLISSTHPTVFYSGPAHLSIGEGIGGDPDLRRLELDVTSLRLNPDSEVQAAPFAIVRLNSATIHRSPVFDEDAIRTFIRGTTYIK